MKWQELLQSGELDGYEEGTPAPGPLFSAEEIDGAISFPCPECGGEAEYKPMVCLGSYRAFAVCTQCGEAYEF